MTLQKPRLPQERAQHDSAELMFAEHTAGDAQRRHDADEELPALQGQGGREIRPAGGLLQHVQLGELEEHLLWPNRVEHGNLRAEVLLD